MEKAAIMAKKATMREINKYNENINYENLEKELLVKINELGIGPAGFGGKTTALAVNIDYYPTHIAGLPVAINISCHASRHAHVTL
jgi:fumarate hydratase subunit alpha